MEKEVALRTSGAWVIPSSVYFVRRHLPWREWPTLTAKSHRYVCSEYTSMSAEPEIVDARVFSSMILKPRRTRQELACHVKHICRLPMLSRALDIRSTS